MYADDIVLLAEDLQTLLHILNDWCSKWGAEINTVKTNVMHCRPKVVSRSEWRFTCGSRALKYCTIYNYLGYWINEFLDLDESKAVGLLEAKKLVTKCLLTLV